MRMVSHRDGCPQQRVEAFVSTRVDGSRSHIVRCIDCGRQSVESPEGAMTSYD
jgi:hypothetical protein